MPVCTLVSPFAQMSGKMKGPPSLSGSEGAVVCMPQPNGQTNVRSMFVPVQPNSQAQLVARANMVSVSEAFQSLTIEQVQGWRDLAAQIILSNRFGADYSPSWNIIFNQVNNFRLQDGQAIVLDAPAFSTTPLMDFSATEQVKSDNGVPNQILTTTIRFLVTADGVAGLPVRLRFTRPTSSPVYQVPANELRMVGAEQEDNWSLTTVVASQEINITSTRININAFDRIGVELMVFTPAYVPAQRVWLRNIEVVEL